jgi:triacylglycerol esterase/lipase EstA (alpha/beta hydrolase family)
VLARAQQIITLSWLAVTIGWLLFFLLRGQALLAVGGAALIAFAHALALGVEFVLLARVNRGDPAPPASVATLLRAWWGEVRTATRVFGWQQPYCSRAEPDHLPVDAAGRRGVVLVHGFVCNRGVWNPWMRKLRAAGVPFVAIDLEPVLGSIEHYPALVDAAVERVERATGMAPVIVGHSMGGLAVRAWLQRYDADRRVHRVITIGTPHHGTWLARFAFVANAREMRQSGEWLSALARAEPPARRARFTCFYSHCDNIAFPASTATLPGADNRHIAGVAHVDLAFHPAVFDEAMAWLRPSGDAR